MKCDNCGTDMPPMFLDPDKPATTDKDAFQSDNALHLRITGGYAEFIDSYDAPRDAILCHDCGHKLVAALPFLAELLRGGHPHSELDEMRDAVDWTIVTPDLEKWDERTKLDRSQMHVAYGDGTVEHAGQ